MMTENEKNSELTLGEYESETVSYFMRSTTSDTGGTTDDGGYTPPTDPAPEIESSTEVPGVYPQPSNPGSGSIGSSTTEGEESGTTMPIYPSVTLISPPASKTEQLKDNHRIQIEAEGTNCSSIKVYVNGTCMYIASGNYLAYSYPVNAAGKYTICVVATSSTGHTATTVSRVVTVAEQTYTVTYDLNEGIGIAPEEQIVPLGEEVILAVVAHPRDCYIIDYTFNGWSLCPEGTDNLLGQGETAIFNSDTTLYAQFTRVVDR